MKLFTEMSHLNVLVYFANLAFVIGLSEVPEKGSVVFRNSSRFSPNTLQPQNSFTLPISMGRMMNSITDEEEFIKQFVAQSPEPTTVVENRLDFVESHPKNDKKPPSPNFARCQPEPLTIPLGDPKDTTLIYFPSSTRVDRCGGCCTHALLGCHPSEIEYKNFTINIYKYVGNEKTERLREKIVTVEVHKKCICDCKTKARDCTSSEVFDPDQCRCICSEGKCPKSQL